MVSAFIPARSSCWRIAAGVLLAFLIVPAHTGLCFFFGKNHHNAIGRRRWLTLCVIEVLSSPPQTVVTVISGGRAAHARQKRTSSINHHRNIPHRPFAPSISSNLPFSCFHLPIERSKIAAYHISCRCLPAIYLRLCSDHSSDSIDPTSVIKVVINKLTRIVKVAAAPLLFNHRFRQFISVIQSRSEHLQVFLLGTTTQKHQEVHCYPDRHHTWRNTDYSAFPSQVFGVWGHRFSSHKPIDLFATAMFSTG